MFILVGPRYDEFVAVITCDVCLSTVGVDREIIQVGQMSESYSVIVRYGDEDIVA